MDTACILLVYCVFIFYKWYTCSYIYEIFDKVGVTYETAEVCIAQCEKALLVLNSGMFPFQIWLCFHFKLEELLLLFIKVWVLVSFTLVVICRSFWTV